MFNGQYIWMVTTTPKMEAKKNSYFLVMYLLVVLTILVVTTKTSYPGSTSECRLAPVKDERNPNIFKYGHYEWLAVSHQH